MRHFLTPIMVDLVPLIVVTLAFAIWRTYRYFRPPIIIGRAHNYTQLIGMQEPTTTVLSIQRRHGRRFRLVVHRSDIFQTPTWRGIVKVVSKRPAPNGGYHYTVRLASPLAPAHTQPSSR